MQKLATSPIGLAIAAKAEVPIEIQDSPILREAGEWTVACKNRKMEVRVVIPQRALEALAKPESPYMQLLHDIGSHYGVALSVSTITPDPICRIGNVVPTGGDLFQIAFQQPNDIHVITVQGDRRSDESLQRLFSAVNKVIESRDSFMTISSFNDWAKS